MIALAGLANVKWVVEREILNPWASERLNNSELQALQIKKTKIVCLVRFAESDDADLKIEQ